MSRTRLSTSLFFAALALTSLHCDEGAQSTAEPTGTDSTSGGAGQPSGGADTGASGGAGAGAAQSSGGTAGSTADPCEGRLLCDDFEDDTPGGAPSAPWKVATNNGAVSVDEARAHSGARSVKVSTAAGQYKQATFFVEGAPVFPVATNVIYGRMMISMDQAANDGVHWTMIQGSGPVPGEPGVTAHYRYGGQHQQRMMANYDTQGAASDCWDHSATKMPTGAWACMEWRFDGAANDLRFWLNGQEITDMHVKDVGEGCIGHDLGDVWLGPTFEKMSLGWESYQADDPREAWIDDVILDDEPIGCPP